MGSAFFFCAKKSREAVPESFAYSALAIYVRERHARQAFKVVPGPSRVFPLGGVVLCIGFCGLLSSCGSWPA
jgi:hypothetical protein